LKPIADGFELNMSCPHAKGYGVEVGQDTELLGKITEAVVGAVGVPVFLKLSSTLPNLGTTAATAVAASAAGFTLINTVGPALAAVGRDPILHNRVGGLSGDGIRPMGLRTVEQVRRAVGSGPVIIGMGGIASPEHVHQYAAAGADLFGIGSALTGLDSDQMRDYLAQLQ
jgi:dihydroorotate dehydrogenase (NAD+) catalytic subunit